MSDAGLVHLRSLTNLESLDLGGTKVAGPGLEHLRGLIHLNSLSLDGAPVGDSSLAYLKDLTQLESLLLACTDVTRIGSHELMRALSKTEVRWMEK